MSKPETAEQRRNRIALRVKPDLRAAVERVAEREDRTVSQVVRRILVAWAKTEAASAQGAAP